MFAPSQLFLELLANSDFLLPICLYLLMKIYNFYNQLLLFFQNLIHFCFLEALHEC